MLRLSRPLLYAGVRCPYSVLGVARSASADDIKRAFKDRVKRTHPDSNATGTPQQTAQFRDLVEAYRVLRDDKRRKEYDFRQTKSNSSQGPQAGAARASGADATVGPASEGYTLVALGFLSVFMLSQLLPGKAPYKDNEHARTLPRKGADGVMERLAKQKNVEGSDPSRLQEELAAVATAQSLGGGSVGMVDPSAKDLANELVRAFYDPFFQMWYKIPDGYEAPSGMDLTAWHNKRSDPVEWSRLLAEDKLGQIIPRGGVQVRYLPAWEAREPILVTDPHTRKTVFYNKALPRVPREPCSVQF